MSKEVKNRAKTPMEKLTQNYEKLIKDKEVKEISQEQFEKTLKQVTKPQPKKQRGSK